MKKALQISSFFAVYFFIFLFWPYMLLAHAQLSGCGEMDIGNPGANQQPPPECQGNQGVACNKVTQTDVSYKIAISIGNSRTINATVWNCDHPAPLVVFVPGQSRSAADYARYEKAIADQGFTVAGINFSTAENNGHNIPQEVADTMFLVGELEADTKFNIQNGNVGLVGHSDGGLVTSMEGYQGHNDHTITAIISADGFTPGTSSGPPLLLLHGAKDQYDGPPNFGGYNANPKYHAEITGADHFCYVAGKSVPGYSCPFGNGSDPTQTQAEENKQSQALDAITGAFLQHTLLGCSNSLQDVAKQYKDYITLEQSGNTGGGHSCNAVSGGLTNPFPDGFLTSRLDMGEDGTFKNRIVAPFAGTITYASNSFSNWGGYIELKADQRPAGLPTSTLYFAEGVGVVVGAGTHVQAGQTIAKPVPSVWNGILGNIEWGVAQDGPGLTDTYSKVVSDPRQMVLDFAKWAEALHVPPPTSTSQAGYP